MKPGDIVRFEPPIWWIDAWMSKMDSMWPYPRSISAPPLSIGAVTRMASPNSADVAVCVFPPLVGEHFVNASWLVLVKEKQDEAVVQAVSEEARAVPE